MRLVAGELQAVLEPRPAGEAALAPERLIAVDVAGNVGTEGIDLPSELLQAFREDDDRGRVDLDELDAAQVVDRVARPAEHCREHVGRQHVVVGTEHAEREAFGLVPPADGLVE